MITRDRKSYPIDTPAGFADRFGVSRETIEKLETYEATLRTWQSRINLVAPSTLEQVWSRHFADSAQLALLAPESASRWLDLGSGAGFPGLVVAILLAGRPAPTPAPTVTLVESDQRKAAFLREVARLTATPVEILSIRIEQAATQATLQPVDVVSARALAPLPRLLHLAAPFLSDASVGLFLKGRDVESEIADAKRHWVFECELVPSLTDEAAAVAVIRHLVATKEVDP